MNNHSKGGLNDKMFRGKRDGYLSDQSPGCSTKTMEGRRTYHNVVIR